MRIGRFVPCMATTEKIIGVKSFCAIIVVVSLLLGSGRCFSQGFLNLGFENTTVTAVLINPYSDFYDYIATVPGWTWSPMYNAAAEDATTRYR